MVAKDDFTAFDPGALIDTSTVPGLLLVDEGQIAYQPNQEDFHCYALSLAIFEAVPVTDVHRVTDAWVKNSLAEPWRFLGVQATEMTGTMGRNRSLLRPYAEAGAHMWPAFVAEGNRFGPFVNQAHDAWYIMRGLHYALANLGIPNADLNRPLPPGGLAELLNRIDTAERAP